MRMRMRTSAVALAVVVSACGGGDDTASTPQPGATDAAAAAPEIVRSTDDRLPEGFPDDFPVPEQRTITESMVLESGVTVYMTTPLDAAGLRAFYSEELPKRGWKITQCTVTEVPDRGPLSLIVAVTADRFSAVTIESGKTLEGQPYDFYLMISQTPVPEQPAATCPPQ